MITLLKLLTEECSNMSQMFLRWSSFLMSGSDPVVTLNLDHVTLKVKLEYKLSQHFILSKYFISASLMFFNFVCCRYCPVLDLPTYSLLNERSNDKVRWAITQIFNHRIAWATKAAVIDVPCAIQATLMGGIEFLRVEQSKPRDVFSRTFVLMWTIKRSHFRVYHNNCYHCYVFKVFGFLNIVAVKQSWLFHVFPQIVLQFIVVAHC